MQVQRSPVHARLAAGSPQAQVLAPLALVLGALIASHRDAVDADRGWSLVVGNGAGAAVLRILELTGLDAVLPMYTGQEEALAAAEATDEGPVQ